VGRAGAGDLRGQVDTKTRLTAVRSCKSHPKITNANLADHDPVDHHLHRSVDAAMIQNGPRARPPATHQGTQA
jgi:hypothetical protein